MCGRSPPSTYSRHFSNLGGCNATLFEGYSQFFNVNTNGLLLRVQNHVDSCLAFEFVEQLTGIAYAAPQFPRLELSGGGYHGLLPPNAPRFC